MDMAMFRTQEEAAVEGNKARRAADAKVRDWQTAVKPGDCFVCYSADGHLVFGEVIQASEDDRSTNCRVCRWFSQAHPDGEVGCIHVSALRFLVTREFFDAMRREGWKV